MTGKEIDSLAKKNIPLSDEALTSDRLLWLVLVSLYREYRAGMVTKETAAKIKRDELENHARNAQGERIFREDGRRMVEIGKLLTAANKNGCPVCKQIAAIFDGRQQEARKEFETDDCEGISVTIRNAEQ